MLAGKQQAALEDSIRALKRFISYASNSFLAVDGGADSILYDLIQLYVDTYEEEPNEI